MKIPGRTETVKVLTKFKQPSVDGTKQYPKLSILCGNEAGTIGCSEELYAAVAPDKSYEFSTVFDDNYKTYKLSGVVREVK